MSDPLTSALIGGLLDALVENALIAPQHTTSHVMPAPAGVVRALPQEAKRGWLQKSNGNEVIIDGQVLRVSPATQVRGPDNLLVLPAQLAQLMAGASSLPIKYTFDPMGAVHRIWILSRAELAAEKGAALAQTPSSAN